MTRRKDHGATTLEAGLLAAGIAVVLVTVLSLTGDDAQALFRSWLDAVGQYLPE